MKDFEATQWYGIVAPTGTPREIVLLLNREIHVILKTPEMCARLESEGAIAAPSTPEEFSQHIRTEAARWGVSRSPQASRRTERTRGRPRKPATFDQTWGGNGDSTKAFGMVAALVALA